MGEKTGKRDAKRGKRAEGVCGGDGVSTVGQGEKIEEGIQRGVTGPGWFETQR
jgi:hypothetical protein